MTTSVRRWIVIAMSLTVLAACGEDAPPPAADEDAGLPGEGKPTVTIGTKDFTEEFILGELYTQALEAKGYTVDLKSNIGSTEIIDQALESGEIDGYPEYTGVAVAVSAGQDIIPKSAEETYDLAKDFYESRGQTVSEATPFFDVDAIAVTKETADAEGLTTVADLKKLGTFTVGARPGVQGPLSGVPRDAGGLRPHRRRVHSSWRSDCSTRRSTAGTSRRPTSSRPTRSSRAASTRSWRTPRASSGSRTWSS